MSNFQLLVRACVLIFPLAFLSAQATAAEPEVSLRKLVLYNSGVGYFELAGEVEGNAKLELKFKIGDVNDLLKSLVLEDAGGGKIAAVTYESKDPLEKTLKTFAIDLTDNVSLADLLRKLRGEKILVVAAQPIEGQIVGVDTHQEQIDEKRTVERNVLILKTDTGLRNLPLESISETRLLDSKLDGELQKALDALAQSHASDKKTVTLNFHGEGKRKVRVGYIQETPVWKTSYRLVLQGEEAPFLQGWAIVENATDQDWKDSRLTLVSGRPISFIMDLYQPLYAGRPEVVPELFAGLQSQVYNGAMSGGGFFGGRMAGGEEGRSRGMGGGMGGMAGGSAPAADVPLEKNKVGIAREGQELVEEPMLQGAKNLAAGATGANLGELFQYEITEPVSLARQQSAMVPIVNSKIEAERIAIFNPAVQEKHPLNGLKLKNSTKLHLMQGPITVFAEGAYAGDARIEDIAPGAERIISYALDLDTEVAMEQKDQPRKVTRFRVAKGVMTYDNKLAREQKYVVKNTGAKPKKVVIEQPVSADWKLVAPEKPAEKSRDTYRFALTAEPNKPAELTVAEERTQETRVAVGSLGLDQIAIVLHNPEITPALKTALTEIAQRRQAIEQNKVALVEAEGRITAIQDEQRRIRENMAQLDRNGDLYKRYVKKFGDQEDEIEKIRGEIKKLTEREQSLKNDFDRYVQNLDA